MKNKKYLLIMGIISALSLLNCQGSGENYSKMSLKGFPGKHYHLPDTSRMDLCFKDIAYDTWQYFTNAVDQKTGFVTDKIMLKPESVAGFTSITNIGLQIIAIISAMDFGFIDSSEAEKKARQIITHLEYLPRYNGYFYNWYNLRTMKETRNYISSVDAAWLYSSLAIVGVAFPELAERCNHFAEQADFGWLYDDSLHHFYLGYDTEKENFSPYHYGLLCSESRICLYLGIILGNVQPENWYHQERTLPMDYDQQQTPRGNWEKVSGISYFKGYYEYNGIKIVPSWGGALFEFLMPGLFVNEQKYAPLGIGENNRRAVEIHIDYALNEKHHPVWGMSPSSIPGGGYGEFGVPEIGASTDAYAASVISPHASILAIAYNPQAVFENLKTLLAMYPIYGEYGFYDSLDPSTGKISQSYLALDQAMILISLNNYLYNGKITGRFEQLPGFEKIQTLLAEDRMF